LNVASGAGRGGLPNLAAYSASKAGLMAFSEALAAEVRQHHIKVMVLAPGSVATGFGEGFPAARPGRSKTPLNPGDVASAALAMVTQPPHAWMSEAVLRPLTLTSGVPLLPRASRQRALLKAHSFAAPCRAIRGASPEVPWQLR
jgi:short-subunit dehydrogenase